MMTSLKSLRLVAMLLLFGVLFSSFTDNDYEFNRSKSLGIFNALYKELDLFYVDSIDAEKVIGEAINAMLKQLDPYTVYYREEDEEEIRMMTTGKYAGIGAVISYHNRLKRVIIMEPYKGMPADEVGLIASDVILEIDGKDVAEMGTTEVSRLLRGEAGTTVLIKVKRPFVEEALEFKVARRNIQLPTIPYYGVVNDSIGYLSLSSFTAGCAQEVRNAVIDLRRQGAKSLMLDLRGNPGGLMGEAVDILGLFLPKNTEVVSTRGRLEGANSVSVTRKEPLDTDMPLVVLIDEDSASASEIVAGALQDLDRAVIVGQKSFGKGLVQIIRDLPYNGHLKVTTSKYYIPSGRCVQAIDYKKSTGEGKGEKIADSDRAAFKTKGGRTVLDAGGVTPDVAIEEKELPALVYYLLTDDLLTDFCTQYHHNHTTIDAPETFQLSDEAFMEFKQYLIDGGFTFNRGSEKALKALQTIAEQEGYMESAKEEFAALEAKLRHDLNSELDFFADTVKHIVEVEILKRYYHQEAAIRYALRYHRDVLKAIEVLSDMAQYNALLAPTHEQQ